jgi:hypothetical protein
MPIASSDSQDEDKDLDLDHKATYMASICEYIVEESTTQASGGGTTYNATREKTSFFCQIEVREASVAITLEVQARR